MSIIESLKFNSDKIRYRTSRSLFIYEHVFVHAGATRGESLLLLCVHTQPILNTHTRIHIYTYRTHIYTVLVHIYTQFSYLRRWGFSASAFLSPHYRAVRRLPRCPTHTAVIKGSHTTALPSVRLKTS